MIDQPTTIDEVRMALSFVSASCDRDSWFAVGAALKDEFGDAGFDLFDDWSQTGDGYNKTDCSATFRSARAGHFTVGTIFKMATEAGWQREIKELTPEQKKAFAHEQAQRKAARDAKAKADAAHLDAMQKAIAAACRRLLKNNVGTGSAGDHPYLQRKQVKAHVARLIAADCRFEILEATQQVFIKPGLADFNTPRPPAVHAFNFKAGDLVVPLQDEKGAIWCVQRISADGTKMFAKFSRKKGCFVLLGTPDAQSPLGFAEGFATAATVHEAMGWPVVACVDAGNMRNVGGLKFANNKKVWLADKDQPDQKGVRKGEQVTRICQRQFGGVVALPTFNNNVMG